MVRKVIHKNLGLSLGKQHMQWKCLVVLYISYHERRTMVEIVYEIGLFPVGKWNSKLKLQDILPYSTVCMQSSGFCKAIFLGELEFPLVNDNL